MIILAMVCSDAIYLQKENAKCKANIKNKKHRIKIENKEK